MKKNLYFATAIATTSAIIVVAPSAYASVDVVVSVENQIAALNTNAADFVAKFDKVNNEYHQLSAEQQKLVGNSSLLEATQIKAAVYKVSATTAQLRIKELFIFQSDRDFYNYVKDVRTLYDALATPAKALVSNYDTLVAYEGKLGNAPKAENAVNQVIKKITALNETSQTFVTDVNGTYNLYKSLSSNDQTLVTNLELLVKALKQATIYEIAAIQVKSTITGLLYVDDSLLETNINEARTAYDKLAIQSQVLVDNLDFLEVVERNNFIPVNRMMYLVDALVFNYEDFLHKDFVVMAKEAMAFRAMLTDTELKTLSSYQKTRIQIVEKQYNQYKGMNFEDSIPFSNLKKITDKGKKWTIVMNDNLQNTGTNSSLIKIVNMFGESIDVTKKIEGNKIIVTPQRDYVQDVQYTIVIEQGLQSVKGQKTTKKIHLPFVLVPGT